MKSFHFLKIVLIALLATTAAKAQTGYYYKIGGHVNSGHSGDGGPAAAAYYSTVFGVTTDASGNIYLGDFANNEIRKITAATGIVTTIAGRYDSAAFRGDGGPATAAQLNGPSRLLFDAHGNLYINDDFNFRIRKIDTTGIITTFAGTDSSTASATADGIAATSAWLGVPGGMAFSASGDMYICVWSAIRKITPAGIISTVVGNPDSFGYSGDGGPATAAKLGPCTGVAFDAAGNMYIADQQNQKIRKVSTSGTITTFAGNGTGGYSGDGGPATAAQMKNPYGMVFDAAGNMLFVDYQNHAIRKVSPAGIISTYAGIGSGGTDSCEAINGARADTSCIWPGMQLAIDASGIVYFGNANKVSKIIPVTLGINDIEVNQGIKVWPNPATNQLFITTGIAGNTQNTFSITNCLGTCVMQKTGNGDANFDISNLPRAIYFVKVSGENGTTVMQFVKE